MKIPDVLTLRVLIEAHYFGFDMDVYDNQVSMSPKESSAVDFLRAEGLCFSNNDVNTFVDGVGVRCIVSRRVILRTTEKGKDFVGKLLSVEIGEGL